MTVHSLMSPFFVTSIFVFAIKLFRGRVDSPETILIFQRTPEEEEVEAGFSQMEISSSPSQRYSTSEPTNNVSGTPKPPWTHLFRGPDTPGRALFRACALSISPHLPERLPDPPHLPTDSPTYARCPSCLYWHIGTNTSYCVSAARLCC